MFSLAACLLPDVIAVDGRSIARQLPKRLQDRIYVVLNGVDVGIFHPYIDPQPVRSELGIAQDALVIGHAARITPWKGQHHLLEAFAQIAGSHPGASLLFVGSALFDNDSYEHRLHLRARELGLDGRVIFAGFRKDLPQVLNAMDIFAYPSVEKDTSPLALISALACGLPVAAFDIDGTREVLEGTGLLVPARDEQGLVDVLGRSAVRPCSAEAPGCCEPGTGRAAVQPGTIRRRHGKSIRAWVDLDADLLCAHWE